MKFPKESIAGTPSPELIRHRQRQKYVPPSPPRAMIRSLRRSGEKPTCLVFGLHREVVYSDFFFVLTVKVMKMQ